VATEALTSSPATGVALLERIRAAAATLILAIAVVFVVQAFVAQPYVVGQISMEPTLLSGDSVLIDKLTPSLDDYSRGDLVVFRPPESFGETPFIKRAIAMPGDVIELRDGAVFVNDLMLVEPYASDGEFGVGTGPQTETARWTVAAAALFVMGDNRSNSVDSRTFGPIPRSTIIGRAVMRYWPLEKLAILQTPSYPNMAAVP
jgi:signal peptidase I